MKYAGGLDIGTSGCKLVLYDENGLFIDRFYEEYDVSRKNGQHEVDAIAVFESVKHVLLRASGKDVAAIAVTSFGETCVFLDENNSPCAPSMLYTDSRGQEECAALIEHFGAENLAAKTGAKPHEMYSLPKIMWVKNNMPEAWKKITYIPLMEDFVVYMLTGKKQIDYSLAARTTAFDLDAKEWCRDILDFCGISADLLSNPVPSGTPAGQLKSEFACELGLSTETVIVSGCHDQIAAMTGANVIECGQVMDGTGTVECIPVIFNEVPKDYALYEYGYSIVPHINGKYACYALSYAGGATIKWFRDEFSDLSYKELDNLTSDEPTDLLIMPHFAGAATPYMDTNSKAAIIGLTFEHGKMDIYRALMEGCAFEMMLNLELLAGFDIHPEILMATGGGASSDIWLQIKADVLNVPVASLDGSEAGGAGTALLAGRAVGLYKTGEKLTHVRKVFQPNAEMHNIYQKQYEKYKKIYQAAKEIAD